jgi:hypothetical protein
MIMRTLTAHLTYDKAHTQCTQCSSLWMLTKMYLNMIKLLYPKHILYPPRIIIFIVICPKSLLQPYTNLHNFCCHLIPWTKLWDGRFRETLRGPSIWFCRVTLHLPTWNKTNSHLYASFLIFPFTIRFNVSPVSNV